MSQKAEGGVLQVRLSELLWKALHAERGQETRSASGRALLLLGLQSVGYDMRELMPDILDACTDGLAPELLQQLFALRDKLMQGTPRVGGVPPVQLPSLPSQPPSSPPPPAPPPVQGGSDPFDIGEEF